jgi:ectoine/hydroxyectoine ABC transporter permease protein EhuC
VNGIGFSPSVILPYLPVLLKAAVLTVEVTFLALVVGFVLGLLGGMARLSRLRPIRLLASAYVSVIRGTPLLVQLFLWYFGLPEVGIRLSALVAAVAGLGLYSGSYQTEILRGAIASIDRGQFEAARTLGLTPWQTMRHVVLPQAFLRALPPLGNEFVALVKNSSLASMITVQELVLTAQTIISTTFRAMEFYLAIGVLYYAITFALASATRYAERRLSIYVR